MPITLDLPPELEAAARREADRRRIPVEQLLAQGLIGQLPADACPEVTRALFQQWRAERQAQPAAGPDDDGGDDNFDYDEFVRGMNANRAGGRIPFPPELKGVTW